MPCNQPDRNDSKHEYKAYGLPHKGCVGECLLYS